MKNRSLIKIIVFVLAGCMMLYLSDRLGIKDFTNDIINGNVVLNENRGISIILYMAFTIFACVLLALPGITFAVLASIVFGPYLGTLLCLVSCTAGASIAFLVGRFFLRDAIKPKLEKNKNIKKFLFDNSGNSEVVMLMVTRLLPIFPFNIQNFAYGVTDISFWKYTILTFLFMIPGVGVYTFLTAGVVSKDSGFVYIVIASALFVGITIISMMLKKKYMENSK